MEREGEKGGDSSWVHDVCIQNDVDRAAAGTGHIIGTTGGHVWDAAKRMAAFLEASEAELGLRCVCTSTHTLRRRTHAHTHALTRQAAGIENR